MKAFGLCQHWMGSFLHTFLFFGWGWKESFLLFLWNKGGRCRACSAPLSSGSHNCDFPFLLMPETCLANTSLPSFIHRLQSTLLRFFFPSLWLSENKMSMPTPTERRTYHIFSGWCCCIGGAYIIYHDFLLGCLLVTSRVIWLCL